MGAGAAHRAMPDPAGISSLITTSRASAAVSYVASRSPSRHCPAPAGRLQCCPLGTRAIGEIPASMPPPRSARRHPATSSHVLHIQEQPVEIRPRIASTRFPRCGSGGRPRQATIGRAASSFSRPHCRAGHGLFSLRERVDGGGDHPVQRRQVHRMIGFVSRNGDRQPMPPPE